MQLRRQLSACRPVSRSCFGPDFPPSGRSPCQTPRQGLRSCSRGEACVRNGRHDQPGQVANGAPRRQRPWRSMVDHVRGPTSPVGAMVGPTGPCLQSTERVEAYGACGCSTPERLPRRRSAMAGRRVADTSYVVAPMAAREQYLRRIPEDPLWQALRRGTARTHPQTKARPG